MKGFKFKLEAVLKMRRLKEEHCKLEIGKLQMRITELKGYLAEHERGIDQAYAEQEEALSKGLSGQELKFHPYFVQGNKASIDIINSEMHMLKDQVDEKLKELARLRAEVKVIDEMKEKHKTQYRKKLEKKQFAEIEEQVQNWRQIIK